MPYQGELAALLAALLWAIASTLYSGIGRRLSPLGLNLAKGAIAILLLLITLGVRSLFGGSTPHPISEMTVQASSLLLLSGALGIGIGDTFYFQALNYIGPRLALLLEALAPPFAALLALVFLQETLSWLNWLGIGLTISGVTWVVSEQSPQLKTPGKSQLWPGVGYGLLAALTQASGAVLSRAALLQSQIDPLESTLVRLGAGVMILVLLLGLGWQKGWGRGRSLPQGPSPRLQDSLWLRVAVAAFLSTYLGIWLQQTSLKYAPAGIAQALSATSPLFILPITAALGERVSQRSVLGVMVALGGVALLLLAT